MTNITIDDKTINDIKFNVRNLILKYKGKVLSSFALLKLKYELRDILKKSLTKSQYNSLKFKLEVDKSTGTIKFKSKNEYTDEFIRLL